MNNINKNPLIISFSLLFAFSYMAMSLSVGLMTPLLVKEGYTSYEIGLFFSVGALAGVFSQIFLGYLVDKFSKLKLFVLLSGLIFTLGNAYIFIFPRPIFQLFLVGLLMSAGGRVFIGLIDTWALEINVFIRGKFGFVRAFSSIGWALGLGVFARLVSVYGYTASSIMISIFMLSSLAIGITIPNVKKHSSVKIKFLELRKLFNAEYLLWLLVFFVIFCEISSEDMILSFRMIELGANTTQIALRSSFQAVFELPLFFMGSRLIKKISSKRIVILAFSCLFLKLVFYANVRSITMMLVGTGFQICTYPLIILTSKYILYDASPDNLKVTGQLFGAAIFGSVSGIVAPVVFGTIAESIGIKGSIFCLAGIVIIPTIISFYEILKNKT